MIRTINFALLAVLYFGLPSPAAAATFTETFDGLSLSNRLSISSSSPAYELSPATPGASWQMTKQDGTITGAVEIKTNFSIDGDFNIELTVDSTNLGTGEVGFRVGHIYVNPWAELFFQGLQGPGYVRATEYRDGNYGIAGTTATATLATIRIARTGDRIRSYIDDYLFSNARFDGSGPVTIFLRPFSGYGAFHSTLGQPDPHAATLHHFTATADVLIPEPASVALLLFGSIVAGIRPRLFLAKHHS